MTQWWRPQVGSVQSVSAIPPARLNISSPHPRFAGYLAGVLLCWTAYDTDACGNYFCTWTGDFVITEQDPIIRMQCVHWRRHHRADSETSCIKNVQAEQRDTPHPDFAVKVWSSMKRIVFDLFFLLFPWLGSRTTAVQIRVWSGTATKEKRGVVGVFPSVGHDRSRSCRFALLCLLLRNFRPVCVLL